MKRGKIILTVSIALGLGAAATIAGFNINAQEVKADAEPALTEDPKHFGVGSTNGELFLDPSIEFEAEGTHKWAEASARFCAVFRKNASQTSDEYWIDMTLDAELGVYHVEAPGSASTYPIVVFARMNPETSENTWEHKWADTGEITLGGNNLYKITGWNNSYAGTTILEAPMRFYWRDTGSWDIDAPIFAYHTYNVEGFSEAEDMTAVKHKVGESVAYASLPRGTEKYKVSHAGFNISHTSDIGVAYERSLHSFKNAVTTNSSGEGSPENEWNANHAYVNRYEAPFVVGTSNDWGLVDGGRVAIAYWGVQNGTMWMDTIGNYLRSCTLPEGTFGFRILKMNPETPDSVIPSESNAVEYSDENCLWKDFPLGNIEYQPKDMLNLYIEVGTKKCAWQDVPRTLWAKGSIITMEVSAPKDVAEGGVDWFDANAVPAICTYANDYYGTWSILHKMTRIGNSYFVRFEAPCVLVLDGYYLCRVDPQNGTYYPSAIGSSTIWTQSTDIDQASQKTPGALVSLLGTKTGDKWNWDGATEGEAYNANYANMWGAVYLATMTCDGEGSMTSDKEDWAATKAEFNALSDAQKTIIRGASANQSGEMYEQGVARYDYILGKYGEYDAEMNPGGFENYIERSNNLGSAPITLNLSNNESRNSVVLIVAAISLTILAVGAGFFLFRRRQSN